MPFQKRPQTVQEFFLRGHDGRMVSGQFQPLGKGTFNSDNVVNVPMKRNRVLSRHDQNRLPKALELIPIALQLRDCCKASKSCSSGHPFLPTRTTGLRPFQTTLPEQTPETNELIVS